MTELNGPQAVVYAEYVEMIESAAEELGVADVDLERLRDQIPPITSSPLPSSEGITLILEVAGRYPIKWEETGKVFEIIGPNMRNKTTTLVYIATLLGLDWDSVEPYLEDRKLIRQANEARKVLSSGAKTHITVENLNYRLVVDIVDGLATGAFWEKPGNDRMLYFEELSLEGAGDWEEYRHKVGGLFDVQFVGKGRNFIAQVGFEEASNLSTFCRQVANTVEFYNRLLMQEAPRRNQREIQRRLAELREREATLQSEKRNVTRILTETKAKLGLLDGDVEVISECLEDENIRELADVDVKLSAVREHEIAIRNANQQVAACREKIADFEESIEENSGYFTRVNEVVEHLSTLYSGVKTDLSIPASAVESLSQALINRDVDDLMSLMQHLEVGEETEKAHATLADFSAPAVSVDTMLTGVTVFEHRVTTLRDFRNYMRKAAENASLLAPMRSYIDELKDHLELLSVTEPGDFAVMESLLVELESAVAGEKQRKTDLERRISELTVKLGRELVPYSSTEDILTKRSALVSSVDLEDYRRLLDKVQYWEEDLGIGIEERLQSIREDLDGQVNELMEKERSLERQLRTTRYEIETKETELDDSRDTEGYQRRIESLRHFRDYLVDIHEYFHYKRLAFEQRYLEGAQSANNLSLAHNNRDNLAERFETVISLVNDRIKKRCPFAYVNDAEVVKREVEYYDFLNEDFHVEGLDVGAKQHGGITSSMTVYGLATRNSGKPFGSVLLVDEWGDAGVYADKVFEELVSIPHLCFSVFVDVDSDRQETSFEVRR